MAFLKKGMLFSLLLFVTGPFCGCRAVDAWKLRNGKKWLTVELDKVVYRGVTERGIHFDVPLLLENRSDGQADVTDLTLSLEVNGARIADVRDRTPYHIAPHGKLRTVLPVFLHPEAFRMEKRIWPLTLLFSGSITVDLGILGEAVCPFRSEKVLFEKGMGKVVPTGISVRKSDWKTFCLSVTFRREGGKGKTFSRGHLCGTVFVDGVKVADFDKTPMVGNEMEMDVSIPLSHLGKMAVRIFQERSLDLKIEGLFSSDTRSLDYRVPFSWEKKGLEW